MFSREQLERYSRQFVLKEIGVSGQKRLLAAKVLVIGAGALGSPALLYLAAAGVGCLGIADFDTVDVSNLQRQIIHDHSRLGINKALSAAETIRELNADVHTEPFAEMVTPDNISALISDYDFIVDATDSIEAKLLINDACVLGKRPFVHAGAARFDGQVMTYIPGQGPCLRCLLGPEPPHQGGNQCALYGVLGAATGILGSIEAAEAIKYLLGIGQTLCGRVLFLRGLEMRISCAELARDPSCPLCGSRPAIHDLNERADDYHFDRCETEAGDGHGQ
ncbi:MAG: HesA/MoeB/ThiF family protein [Firmicutes bacterium]|nr:HesA/MoeB/ThiF family protein [Bacillota bacterium]